MSYLVTKTISHRRAVMSLYKRAYRCEESWCRERDYFRLKACQLRKRFDDKVNLTDMREAKALLDAGEEELFQSQHYQPMRFPFSPGGVAFEREIECPDWVLDYWHPLEKAQYPKYFATREKRKLEYIAMWEKNNPGSPTHH